VVIICPKCARKLKINLSLVKSHIESGKKVSATCRSCKYKFPVLMDQLVDSPSKEKEGNKAEARKICITLSKGGVGKTTTSVNLGAGLALAGYKVLLVDTDTQGQSSYILGKKPKAGLTELLTKELTPDECVVHARKNLWLLSGGKSLAGVKRIIDLKSFGAEWTLTEAMKPWTISMILSSLTPLPVGISSS